jgi:single-strand DNA-binding protein
MNEVVLVGRLSREPKVQESQTTNYVKFAVAVERPVKSGEKKQADFPQCIAFGKTADVIGRYGFKGQKVAISGRIQTSKYKKQTGETIFNTEVIVNRVEFLEWQDKQEQMQTEQPQTAEQTLEPDIPESFEGIDEDVPF